MDKTDLKLSHEDDHLLLAPWSCRTGGVSGGAAVRLSGVPLSSSSHEREGLGARDGCPEPGRRGASATTLRPSCKDGHVC